jgi:tRNA modification GTPase|uniref:tRNA modification GTPase MnmE n=1 Tax=candidate division WOR-3 bacterium TaxID=2052148 RepID=A0A7V3UZL3_UNCW3
MRTDTIVAPATPPGVGALAVIRISGPDTFKLLKRLFPEKDLQSRPGYSTHLCWLNDDKGKPIDQVLITIFHQPRSYTGEDMAEIAAHGSPLIVDKIIHLCSKNGARIAEPGEFTRRAVLNGKLSLSQAEAVLHLVKAQTPLAHRTAINAYRGAVSRMVANFTTQLFNIYTELEYRLGFAEDQPGEKNFADTRWLDQEIRRVINALNRELQRAEISHRLFEPARVAIVGRANVGKSSLFNRLLQDQRAITSPIPGTTRDRIESRLDLAGITLRLIDTCGFDPKSRNPLTRIGTTETRRAIQESDFILVVFDGSQPVHPIDKLILAEVEEKPKMYIINKGDLKPRFRIQELGIKNSITISCKTGENLNRIRVQLRRQFNSNGTPCPAITRRQIDCLENCRRALIASLKTENLEMRLLEVKNALDNLTAIDAPVTSEQILNRIFEHFCIGK